MINARSVKFKIDFLGITVAFWSFGVFVPPPKFFAPVKKAIWGGGANPQKNICILYSYPSLPHPLKKSCVRPWGGAIWPMYKEDMKINGVSY